MAHKKSKREGAGGRYSIKSTGRQRFATVTFTDKQGCRLLEQSLLSLHHGQSHAVRTAKGGRKKLSHQGCPGGIPFH